MHERIAPAPDLTRMRLRVGVAFVSLAASLLCASNAFAANVTVSAMINNTFNPPAVTISPGDTVTWNNIGSPAGDHNVTFPDGYAMPAATSTMAWSVSRTFTAAGTFNYVCGNQFHASMTGTVTVLAAAPPPSGGGGGGGGTPGGDPGTGAPGGGAKTDLKRLRLKLSDATTSAGSRVRFYGSVRPAIKGRVLIQRRGRKGKYRTVTRVKLKEGQGSSSFSKRLRARAGVYRVVIRENADHDGATSKPKRIR